MRRRLQGLFASAIRWLQPKPDLSSDLKAVSEALADSLTRENRARSDYVERQHELAEARQMAGVGPWLTEGTRGGVNKPGPLRESVASEGTVGLLALELENLQWRREINYSWLEFSRWGIQQIILLSRLYYIKNPLIQRGINVAAHYVFGRGVEVGSPDDTANEILKQFFEDNKQTLGQIALTDLERRKYYDGNLFFCFFPDRESSGSVKVRTIDAVEIQDIVTDPNDTDTPWYYRRSWTERIFDPKTGATSTQNTEAWYPALGYEPADKVPQINSIDIRWDNPILHRRCGAVAKWLFGCPLVYAALDWSREARRFLEACATVKQSLAQISMTLTTKGGQQALAGMKQQLQTSAGPPLSAWDTNPTAVNGSIFASGPGTTLAAFNTKGAGGDPEEVRRYILMVCAVFGFPETFFGDVQTGNLATAQSLDRPTELNFLEKQEAWREDLLTISKYVLSISRGAAGGRLREAKMQNCIIVDASRVQKGHRIIMEAAKEPKAGIIEVTVNFPSILEGDIPAAVKATVEAMTLSGHPVTGIDAKAGVRHLYDQLGIAGGDELTEEQFPERTYEPDRTAEDEPEETDPAVEPTEAVSLARRLVSAVVKERNGKPSLSHSR